MVKSPVLAEGEIALGKYEVIDILHTGSMSNVYMVKDQNLGSIWCLKETFNDHSKKGEVRYKSVLKEAHLMKGLSHEGIPRIVALEESNDKASIIMDYVAGKDLSEVLVEYKRLPEVKAVYLMKQIAAVMSYLHSKNVAYRDLKPSNIMIQDGKAKLLDFGISEVISPGNDRVTDPLGTKGFAPPEQATRGAYLDTRSDIYAFGATLFTLLTGIPPAVYQSQGAGKGQIDFSITLDILKLKSTYSQGLSKIILKCTELKPEDRYSSFAEVLYALQNYEKADSGIFKRSKRRLRALTALTLGTALFAGLSVGSYFLNQRQKEDTYQQAVAYADKTGRVEDYHTAISYEPLKISPYQGMIDVIKEDGEYSEDERKLLLDLVNPNLAELKNVDGYGDLAFSIGQLNWFYTEDESTNKSSTRWFEDAARYGAKESEQANIFASIANFDRNLAKAVQESSENGLYLGYWNNLLEAKNVGKGEILEVQLNLSIAKAISNYSYRLHTDGVSKEDIFKEISNLEQFVKSNKPITEKAKKHQTDLESLVHGLKEKVEISLRKPGE